MITLEISFGSSNKVKQQGICNQHVHSLVFTQEKSRYMSIETMYKNVSSCFICISQKLRIPSNTQKLWPNLQWNSTQQLK